MVMSASRKAVLGPVTIGDEARIGPNVVVMTDVPAGATVFVNTASASQDASRGDERTQAAHAG